MFASSLQKLVIEYAPNNTDKRKYLGQDKSKSGLKNGSRADN